MSEKLKNKIMNIDYRKTAKIYIIISLILILTVGTISAISLKTQINEAISYCRSDELGSDKDENIESEKRHYAHKFNSEESEKEHNLDFEDIAEENFTEPSLFSKICVGVLGVICFTVAVLYWLLIAGWLYKASAESSMNAVLWGVLGLICNLAAVILFMIVRSTYPVCTHCGKRQKHGSYCRYCGNRLGVFCGNCGKKSDKKDLYCHNCGKSLRKKSND